MGCRRVGLNVSEKKQNVMTRERGLLVPDQLLIVVEFLTIFDSSWITILKSWSKIVGFLFINSFFFLCVLFDFFLTLTVDLFLLLGGVVLVLVLECLVLNTLYFVT